MKKNFFTFLPVENGEQNWFDLSHTNSGSCNMGGLYPVVVEPTLPGDYFRCDISYLLRMAQMVAPPMSRIGTSFFAFYCPNRILMDSKEWDKFIADVDGTSGVSLPTLSFAPIFGHIKESVDFDKFLSFMNRYLSPLSLVSIGVRKYEVYYKGSLIQAEEIFENFMDYDDYKVLIDRLYELDDQFDYGDFDTGTPFGIVVGLLQHFHQYPFVGTLLDYMGFPVNSPLMDVNGFISARVVTTGPDSDAVVEFYTVDKLSPTRAFQVLPLIAYFRIWNEYFRQEFIQEEIDSEMVDDFNAWSQALSTDISILWKIKRRDWEHDYFTSCLPAPQLGESSSIEIGSDGKFTIPELREANVIQRIREKLLHGGTRIWEIVANFFSERISDSRIQIPEFIKPSRGGFSWLRISDIYQTAPGASDTFPTLDASANIAAPRGAAVNTNNGISFNFKAEEHGYLIVLMNVQPEPVYCQGVPRHFLSLDTLDYGWPDFANITEQPVYQYEVYATPNNTRVVSGDYPIFGWQSQYAWYKFHQSELHGELRDDLDFFTFARIFEDEPYLNDEFLQCNPSDRPFPISYEYDKLTYHLAIDLRVNRRLPYFGIPSLR